jgi:hypothetical protein
MISIKGEDDRLLVSGSSLGAAWTPDGELIFASSTPHETAQGPIERLFRMRVFGSSRGRPQWIRAAGERAAFPTVGGGRFGKPLRIVFQQATFGANLWRSDGQNGHFATPRKVAASTRLEMEPRMSPKGDRIAFVSDRTGNPELWVAQADGERPLQLTHFGPAAVHLPSWSPDGRRLIFHSRKDSSNNNLFVISAEGSAPQRITSHTANNAFGSWSRDGQWIYFSSDRSGIEQVWKMKSDGDGAVQLTKGSGYRPFEAPDGRVVFRKNFDERLWSVGSDGTNESLLAEVRVRDFAVIDEGVLLVEPPVGPNPKLKLLSSARKRIEPFGNLIELPPGLVQTGFSASSDGRRLVFIGVQSEVDLTLIEGFR